jgi:PBP1b-binding outer membrane lipoprotein LpoB
MNPERRDFFMWKRMTMLFGISALLLVGCNNNNKNDLPKNNETPMEDVREDTQDLAPGTNDENPVEPTTEDKNLDGDKDMIKDPNTTEEEIIEDDLDARDADNKDE